MKIKTKLTYGIGILFILILILGVVAGKYITDMSTDTRNILADNYQSLSYARQMLYSLENLSIISGNSRIILPRKTKPK